MVVRRPNVLVVACSDGRLQEATDVFLANHLESCVTIASTSPAARVRSSRADTISLAHNRCVASVAI